MAVKTDQGNLRDAPGSKYVCVRVYVLCAKCYACIKKCMIFHLTAILPCCFTKLMCKQNVLTSNLVLRVVCCIQYYGIMLKIYLKKCKQVISAGFAINVISLCSMRSLCYIHLGIN